MTLDDRTRARLITHIDAARYRANELARMGGADGDRWIAKGQSYYGAAVTGELAEAMVEFVRREGLAAVADYEVLRICKP